MGITIMTRVFTGPWDSNTTQDVLRKSNETLKVECCFFRGVVCDFVHEEPRLSVFSIPTVVGMW